jgi:hypothetical protein
MRTAQRDRALEAVEKLRDSVKSFINAGDHSSRSEWMRAYKGLKIALAAKDPATVELPKCDHCGAIGCGTDCDGSSHYTTENFRRFEKRSGVATDVDK